MKYKHITIVLAITLFVLGILSYQMQKTIKLLDQENTQLTGANKLQDRLVGLQKEYIEMIEKDLCWEQRYDTIQHDFCLKESASNSN